MKQIPNFFMAGTSKCGTTSMARFFSEHPDIFITPVKEPEYFCSDIHREAEVYHRKNGTLDIFELSFPYRTKKKYFALYDSARDEKIVGEASVIYIRSPEAAKRIHKFKPKAKILIMIREPVEMLYSLHSQLLSHFREDEEDFRKALALEPERKRGKRLPPRVRAPRLVFYSEWVAYAQNIKEYLKHFPREQVKIIVYEDFKEDNLQSYREVLHFLGVNEEFVPELKQHNQNLKIRFKSVRYLAENPRIFLAFKRLLPQKTYLHIKRALYALTSRKERREPLDVEFRRALQKKFYRQVVELDRLLKKEGLYKKSIIKRWGYDAI